MIEQVLPAYDWVFWADADALFMRGDAALDEFVDDSADLIWSSDENGPNMGHFFLRNCPEAFRMMRVAYAREDLIHHPWWEQAAVRETLQTGLVNVGVKEVPLRLFNAHYTVFQPEDMVIHFAGDCDKNELVGRFARAARVGVP